MKTFWKKHRQVITYFIYGAGTTLANLIVYTLLVTLGSGITVANAAAWFAAMIFAFVTNKIFVFESRRWDKKTLFKEISTFCGARIFSGILEIVLPTLLFYIGLNQTLFGIEGFVAKIIVSVIVIILNYVLSKRIVFRKK